MSRKSRADSIADTRSDCPCQSGLTFQQCCQRFLDSTLAGSAAQQPETAEQLMRSRYCAYVLKNSDYLLKTWHPDYRPETLVLEGSVNHWLGLKIKNSHQGNKNDTAGQVHFIAFYKINGKAYKLEENSQFKKINSQWLYLNGELY
ncbi:MAG: YchJ family protein [Gammaproteobacteria bacterium]|nr:YchJ family protein [Gammaproteobacteria bacterium]